MTVFPCNLATYDPSMDSAVASVRLANGLSLPYIESGDPMGTPMVLVHAWGESKGCFDRLLPALPPFLRVFAMDQRGHGHADKPEHGYQLSEFASDIVEFLDAVSVDSIVLVGSSSGGYVAQQVAVEAPNRVSALVLVGSPRTLQRNPDFAGEIEKLADPIDPEWVRSSLEWFPLFHAVPDWYLDGRVADGVRMPARVWREALEGLMAAPPPTDIGIITAPTLIIWGDRDDLLPFDEQKALSTAISESRLVVYEDTGHLVLWEQPERLAQDLIAFVEELGLDGGASP
jgi:pimeloyl-ACP methyl ester carboxylesterase